MTPPGKLAFSLLLLLAVVSSSPTSEEPPTTTDEEEEVPEEDWRDNTLIYHIRPRSFQDSNGDGEGDLRGIISRLDYLVEIGIDTIRLSPIYSSSELDSGYHILNHTDIDSIYGDFDDFEDLVQEVHKRDLKIILDVIPNQSSNEHEWFVNSALDIEPYDDYYIWADGRYVDNKVIPPNNWKSANSHDDGSAWTWHTKKRMWYYHKFSLTEPDLNLRNEDVIEDILEIFDFWLAKDVDGFCICGISYLYENEDLIDETTDQDDLDGDGDEDSVTIGLSENAILIQRIREHVDEWVKDNNEQPKLLIGEVDELDDEIISYYGNETNPGIVPLNLMFVSELNDTCDAADIKNLIEDWMERLPEGAETNWQLSNQDNSRAASRFDPDFLDGITMLTLLLPGQAITYYGEEIGMKNANISSDESDDDTNLEETDQFRTPMQWNDSITGGFSSNDSTFLPVNPDYAEINVKKQLHDLDSNLEAYKILSSLREIPVFTNGDYELYAVNEDNVLILKRSFENDTCLVTINFGSSKEVVNLTALFPDLEMDLNVIVDSSNTDVENANDDDDDNDIENDSYILEANAAAVLCEKDYFADSTTETPTTTVDDDNSEESVSTIKSSDLEEANAEAAKDETDDDDDINSASGNRFHIILVISMLISPFLQIL